ncbi:Pyrrolysyl-tRNA synthetase [Desulfocicer vacuolatum DSM 3385]|uniref:Pyrrolysyl-tRNA synthetase n=1 Tax=Desulfocicer vacuolatum DSM 3385 TaxID=1121400 RepID=A0A1W2CR31_9BACT|nr:pyrrolysine--tRNA(Pyl) ligase large subunit [Desulfocicer vacuolatum]SMC87342.1 Pyrrolysyl-tRNA synthetase [Desulfocicer vacuolatum DSM 3385]
MNEIVTWTDTQLSRLKELEAGENDLICPCAAMEERNQCFQRIEKRLVKQQQQKLRQFLTVDLKPRLIELEERLTAVLNELGFSRVTTPVIISREALDRMTVDRDHPLSKQVYWLDDKHCLRPMLAPNLYQYMVSLGRLKARPIRFFEIGSCFRKESDGARHNSEFTMLNLVEMGVPMDQRQKRLKQLAKVVADAAGLKEYEFETEESVVYGETLDVVAGSDGIEVASGAMGPHPLDAAWRITDSWVGLGFGLERLVMVAQDSQSIGKWGKSVSWINGIRLNL